MSYILVLDDDATTREYLRRLLTEEGYEVRTAADGAAALAELAVQPPALILLNQRMLPQDGTEFVRLYLETPQPHAPIILVTVPETSIEAGCVLGRPRELLEVIELVHRNRQD